MARRKIGVVGKRENTNARKDAFAIGEKRYFTGLPCKYGHVTERQTSNGRCVACTSEYVQANILAIRANMHRHEQKDVAKKNARIQAWAKANPHKRSAIETRRRVAKMQRTPTWLTADEHWMVEQAYELAALRTRMFGFSWHVDHIVPLQGKLVSGLHTPYNLQVIPGRDNLRKNNRYEVTF